VSNYDITRTQSINQRSNTFIQHHVTQVNENCTVAETRLIVHVHSRSRQCQRVHFINYA